MSEAKKRIQKDIKTNNSNRVGIAFTENISFVLLERRPTRKFQFQEDKVFIPFKELELDSFTAKKFPYKITYTKNGNTMLKNIFDFSKQTEADNEMKLSIQEKDTRKESAKCKIEFPILVHQDLKEEIAIR